MIDDRSVPFVVLALVIVIAILGWPAAQRSRSVRRRASGEERIERLAETLGIGIIVQSVDIGPPAAIAASLLLDTSVHHVTATGASEPDAWDDLARQAVAWKNDDPRNARTYFGGF